MKWTRVDGDWQFGEHATIAKLAGAKRYAEKAVQVEMERRAAVDGAADQ